MSLLQIKMNDKVDITNAVNAGKKVIISKTEVTQGNWTGAGYIVLDPTTGAAGYQISGGLSGSDCDYLPVSVREKPAFVDLYWKTYLIRNRSLRYARAYIGMPYWWDGKPSEIGFDCSGFIHDLYETQYLANNAMTEFPEGTAAAQYTTCESNEWLEPYSERMPGDIVWKSGLGHVGIFTGWNTITWPPNSTISYTGETVVHASGRPCTGTTACGTQVQCVNGNPACGTFRRVIESPLRLNAAANDAFGVPADKVCNPR